MGTDIHYTFQKLNKEVDPPRWENVKSEYKRDRDYLLFAVLADVRNGFGFAGVPIFEPVEPISEPRGLPVDLSTTLPGPATVLTEEEWEREYENRERGYLDGDHSFSWLTADEMLNWRERNKDVEMIEFGVISRKDHDTLEYRQKPTGTYCGWLSGKDILVLPDFLVRGYKDFKKQVLERNKDAQETLGLAGMAELANWAVFKDYGPQEYLEGTAIREPFQCLYKYILQDARLWKFFQVSDFYNRVEQRAFNRNNVPLEDYTHVRVIWSESLCQQLDYFFDEVKRLKELHGDVRMVFSFDS